MDLNLLREITKQAQGMKYADAKKRETELLESRVKQFFSKRITEERMLLFANNARGFYPLVFIDKSTPQNDYYEREKNLKARLVEPFDRLLVDAIEASGFKAGFKRVSRSDLKDLKALEIGDRSRVGIYLSLIWCD